MVETEEDLWIKIHRTYVTMEIDMSISNARIVGNPVMQMVRRKESGAVKGRAMIGGRFL